jgi:Glycosyl transferase family 2
VSAEPFGHSVQTYAASLNGVPAIVADASMPAQALAAAVRRRRSPEPFWSAVLLDDPRALVAYEYASQLLAAQTDEDGRRKLFDAMAAQALTIGTVAQGAIRTMPDPVANVLCDVMMMGEGMLVRSWSEAERLAALFGRRRELIGRFPGAPQALPAGTVFGGGDAVVVWAPGLSARHTALYAYALKDFYLPVLIACHQAPDFPTGRVEYVTPDTNALRRAAAVIDTSIGGPEAAMGLAELGAPLAITSVSGASEYVSGAYSFEPWNWRSIQAAAQRTLGAVGARLREGNPTPAELAGLVASARAAIPRNGPLVSVLMATYNHRYLLPQALDSLARQEYQNVEVVVVNDGGEPVDDIVARYPNARLVVNEKNLGPTQATNVGMRSARGQYIAFCSDDDMLFPDTIGRWAHALRHSGGRVVNGNTVMRFDRRAQGRAETIAYQLIWKDSVDHRDSAFTPFTPLSCAMLHRDVLDEVGYYEDSSVADIEYLLRLSQRYDFIHVDQPCVELEYDASRGQGKAVGFAARAEQLERMYARFPTGSADVAAGRKAKIDWHHQRAAVGSFFEPAMLLPEPEIRE